MTSSISQVNKSVIMSLFVMVLSLSTNAERKKEFVTRGDFESVRDRLSLDNDVFDRFIFNRGEGTS